LRRLTAEPEFIKMMETSGSRPVFKTPDQFDAFIKSEWERWGRVIRDANLKVE
jgi:tripartite-type tricarboxylate transporter receptor subunit TctC